jgi:hypothetical protein
MRDEDPGVLAVVILAYAAMVFAAILYDWLIA